MHHKKVMCLLLCILTLCILVNAVSADDWPMFHHDADHTGYTTSNGPLTNSTLWTFKTSDEDVGSPVVANGYVYVACNNVSIYGVAVGPYEVYCLNATSSAEVWNFTSNGYVSTPAVASGYVYLGSAYSSASPYDGYLYCLNAVTGAQVWNYSAGSYVDVGEPVITNGHIYVGTIFGTTRGELLCLNATSGAQFWNFSTPGQTFVSVSGSHAYVGAANTGGGTYLGVVYCLDASTGASVWNYSTHGSPGNPPVAYNGYVYFGTGGVYADKYNVYCLNAVTAAQAWNVTIVGGISTIAVANGNIYVADIGGTLYCLNALTGAEVWWFAGSGTLGSSPAVTASGYLYIGYQQYDYHVYCLNSTDGAEMWSYNTGAAVSSSPAIVNGVLYIGSDDYNLYALGTTHPLSNATLTMDVSAQNQQTSYLFTISGTLTPAQPGTVTIWEITNNSYTTPNPATLSGGAYSIKIRIFGNGTNQFYATWPGNSQYNSVATPITTYSIPPVPEFSSVALILVLLLAVSVAMVASRKLNRPRLHTTLTTRQN